MTTSIDTFLKQLIPELRKSGAITMSRNGIHVNSDLINSFEFNIVHGRLQIEANDYYEYVDKGRRARVGKVPITPLIRWMRQYRVRPQGGQTYTQLAFAIQQSIYKSGIKGKNYLNKLYETYGDLTQSELGDYLEESLLEDIVNSLTNK